MVEGDERRFAVRRSQPRAFRLADQIARERNGAFTKGLLAQIGPINEFAVAITGVAATVAAGALVVGHAAIGERPVAEWPAGLMMPETALSRPTEMVAVKVAGEGLATPQMDDAGVGRIPAVIHLVPLATAGDLPPAGLHRFEVGRPGKWIARQRRARLAGNLGVADHIVVPGDYAVAAKQQSGHVCIENVPRAV